MGRYDDITREKARSELLRFAELIQRMDRDEILLQSSPRILKMLGELRQMLFAYEIRGARHLGGKDLPGPRSEPEGQEGPAGTDPASWRVVQEALRREKEFQEELERRLFDGHEEQD
ncbi:MAG: hypothetical protein EXR95_10345 [Gemmatimonadetes bacterium]|nr:hypothetical protein [Gemmatimonadota bacterium]